MAKETIHRIRPAGRHLITIGRDLIQDQHAALAELVKNAYDADATLVTVEFKISLAGDQIRLIVQDNGHGMSRETVINKWLVPSTADKLDRKRSPLGRIMQGRKGIGRYAAAMLGEELLLETVTSGGIETQVLLNWNDFENAIYLDDVDVLVESGQTKYPSGTRLTISGSKAYVEQWNSTQFKRLHTELRKLISPLVVRDDRKKTGASFKIDLVFDGVPPEVADLAGVLEPFPLLDLFDYRIHGKINEEGKGKLTYECRRARNTPDENIFVDYGPTRCGPLDFDIRVFDREPDAIAELTERYSAQSSHDTLGRLDTKQLLNEMNGIGVYRNGFRIRPLGDPDFDWLKLNERRIQNPSQQIGNNQVLGNVQIASEEVSFLQEKSARDGLRDNDAYFQLRKIAHKVIGEVEQRRFIYRSKAGLSRRKTDVETQIQGLFSFDSLRKKLRKELTDGGVPRSALREIEVIVEEEEKEKARIADELRNAIAVYQGQATLGKIINAVLHEARRPLNFFRNQIPNLDFWIEELGKTKNPDIIGEIVTITEKIPSNANVLVHLFRRLDPLAARKRAKKKNVKMRAAIEGAVAVFEQELLDKKIAVEIVGDKSFSVMAWEQDIYAIFTNLIDNSIFWMAEKKSKTRCITVELMADGESIESIDYQDTGPGIEPHLIESGVIFEPEFTTKVDGIGSGLGLAIAGEAATRSGLELTAVSSDTGAHFVLRPNGEG